VGQASQKIAANGTCNVNLSIPDGRYEVWDFSDEARARTHVPCPPIEERARRVAREAIIQEGCTDQGGSQQARWNAMLFAGRLKRAVYGS